MLGYYSRFARVSGGDQYKIEKNGNERRSLARQSTVRNLFRLGNGGGDSQYDDRARLSRSENFRYDGANFGRDFDFYGGDARRFDSVKVKKLFLSVGNRVGVDGDRRSAKRTNSNCRVLRVCSNYLFSGNDKFCDGDEAHHL